MSPRKPSRREMAASAGQLGPGDGQDPRHDRPDVPRPAGTRKALQLCREAERTLGAVLAGECDDDVLRELTVLSVVPAPNAGRLLVTVAAPGHVPVEEVLERLGQVMGQLRSELASAVSRRRTPELAFQVVRGGPGG